MLLILPSGAQWGQAPLRPESFSRHTQTPIFVTKVKFVVQIIASIATAVFTALGATSCMDTKKERLTNTLGLSPL